MYSEDRTKKYAVVFTFLLFTLAGGAGFYSITIGPIISITAAKDWKEKPCTILSCNISTHKSGKIEYYDFDIFYSYVVDDKEYHSNKYSFMGQLSTSNYNEGKEFATKYRIGSTNNCYVNPRDPNEAVLDNSYNPKIWNGLIALVFGILGLVGIILVLMGRISFPLKQ